MPTFPDDVADALPDLFAAEDRRDAERVDLAGDVDAGRELLDSGFADKVAVPTAKPQPQRNPNHSKTTTTAKTQPQQNRMQVYAQHKKHKNTLKTHEKQ